MIMTKCRWVPAGWCNDPSLNAGMMYKHLTITATADRKKNYNKLPISTL